MKEVKDYKFLKILRKVSIIEGISTLLLFFVAMPLKYMADMPMAVSIFGSIHGVLFLILVGFFIIALDKVPINLTLMITGIVAAIVPFGPFVYDHWLKKLEQS